MALPVLAAPDAGPAERAVLLGRGAWLGLFGGNAVYAVVRFRRLVRRTVEVAGR